MSEPLRDAASMAMLEKAAMVLGVLEAHGEQSAARIADAVDEPLSSTYRLLTNLGLIGWVDPGSRRGLYRLGVEVLRVGGLLEDRLSVREVCGAPLKRLRMEHGVTSYLCVRRRQWGVCIERLDGRDVRSLAMHVGDFLPLSKGAAMRALLSFLPEGERDLVVRDLSENDDAGRPPVAALQEIISQTREQGFAVSDGDVTTGIAAIGAPVFNHRGELEGAISVSGLRDSILSDVEGMARAVVRAAGDASAALGYVPQEREEAKA